MLRNVKAFVSSIQPHRFFFVTALCSGLLLLLLTPPFQVPDEINHFYRAYQVSEGHFISVKLDNRVGGELPASLQKITEPFVALTWSMHNKTGFEQIAALKAVPLHAGQRAFYDFPNTAVYSGVSYIPQAASIWLLRSVSAPPLLIFYGARLFTLLFWALCMGIIIRRLPVYQWLFTLLGLLPMAVFEGMSLSADVMTNLLGFALIAEVLRLAYTSGTDPRRHYWLLLLLTVLLASAKLIYTPLAGLFLLVPASRYGGRIAYLARAVGLFAVALGMMALWSKIMDGLYVPYHSYHLQFRDQVTIMNCADKDAQLQYILEHGRVTGEVFMHSMAHSFTMYYEGYIGTFGWGDTFLPGWLVALAYSVIVLVAAAAGSKEVRITPWHKIVSAATALALVAIILLSQHLIWDCVGGDLVQNLQGRYFIPVFPLLFIVFYNRAWIRPGLVRTLVTVFPVVLLAASAGAIYHRYYVPSEFDVQEIVCDAERITTDSSFATNLPGITLEKGNTRSAERARSGMYSAMLTPERPFGFTTHLGGCKRGDRLIIGMWRWGKGPHIVLDGEPFFYQYSAEGSQKDSSGWEYVYLEMMVPANMGKQKAGITIWNNTRDTCYVDDVVIRHERLR